MYKPLMKKIAHAKKEHGKARKEKCHSKSESHHKRCHSLGKHHAGKTGSTPTCAIRAFFLL
eukprot:12215369-Ditylum_brightwellii.AAC.1